MKKFISIVLTLVMILSTSVIAFAADVYTCPVCSKKYNTLDEYNACVSVHNTEDKETPAPETVTVYDCPTCGKKYDNLDDYNACVDTHYNDIYHHYDKYIGITVVELIKSFVDIFETFGIKEIFTNIFEKAYSLILGAIETA